MMATAFEILQSAAGKLNALSTEDEEVTSFFKHVTAKVKNYSPGSKMQIFEI